jgi:hypothetical protein
VAAKSSANQGLERIPLTTPGDTWRGA